MESNQKDDQNCLSEVHRDYLIRYMELSYADSSRYQISFSAQEIRLQLTRLSQFRNGLIDSARD
jgi:hypothetical protein